MAFSWQEQVKPAGTQDIQCDIEYLDKSYIHVYLDGTETTAFTWTSSTNIRLNSPLSAETVVLLIRKTEREYLYIEFASGSPFIEVNVDSQNTQFLHLAQELVEGRAIPGFYGDISMNGYRITSVGAPIDAADAANKAYVDSSIATVTGGVESDLSKTLRAPETISTIPGRSSRAQSLLGFNSGGEPIAVFSMTETADLAIKLASDAVGAGASLVNTESGVSVQGRLDSGDAATLALRDDLNTLKYAVGVITPEMYGAVGDGVTDDTAALQAALTAWLSYPQKQFYGPGTYVLSSPVTVISPAQGSRGFINGALKAASWTDAATSLFSRKGALFNMDIAPGGGSNMWGAYFEVGSIQDKSTKSSPKDYHVHGIRNMAWQQCQIVVGLAQGLISAMFIDNSKNTTPTNQYSIRMARSNLINYYAPYNLSNMYEGCTFHTGWSSGGSFCAEMLGNGSTYSHITGGSADFAGQYLNYLTFTTTPSSLVTGAEVTNADGTLIGWVIGWRYTPGSTVRRVIIAELSAIASASGTPTNSAIAVGDTLTFNGASYVVATSEASNNSHTTSRFLPTTICTATTAQTIVRWRIERDYDSGVIFPNDIYHADSQVDTSNEVIRRKVPLPLGSYFDSGISSGALILNGARYATRLNVNNLEITTQGGISTAKHSSVWKLTNATTGNTVLASDDTTKTIVAFTLSGLGGGQITGRISGRATDPATDTVGLWEVVGFGVNADGTAAIDKWDVVWGGGAFAITKTVAGTAMSLSATTDSAGLATLSLTGGMSTTQAAVGASWQYRAAALRKFML